VLVQRPAAFSAGAHLFLEGCLFRADIEYAQGQLLRFGGFGKSGGPVMRVVCVVEIVAVFPEPLIGVELVERNAGLEDMRISVEFIPPRTRDMYSLVAKRLYEASLNIPVRRNSTV